MSTTLSRRIRRIGLVPSIKNEKGLRVHIYDPAITAEDKDKIAAQLRAEAKARRIARRGNKKK
jgi:hypothetical protein